MSNYPPPGPPPPPYYGYAPPPQWPYAYVPAPVMMPMPLYGHHNGPHGPPMHPPAQPPPEPQPHPTYVTNYYYQQPPQQETMPQPLPEPVRIVEGSRWGTEALRAFKNISERLVEATSPRAGEYLAQCISISIQRANKASVLETLLIDIIDWVPTTPSQAPALSHRAFVAGKEGWDSSPLWVIRAHHSGEFVPGKLAVKHRSAYIPHAGKEVPVHNVEVLCAPAHALRWLPASNGQVPVGAIPAGNTHNAEPLYIARVRHLKSLTPGKVHPGHNCCYISFGGVEISYKSYEVLCQIVG